MKLHSLTAIAAATLFAGAVGAQTPPIGQPTQPVTPSSSPSSSSSGGASGASASGGDFTSVDKDADGSISKKEAAANKDLTKKWDTLDANKDGKLDQGEFAQFEASGSMDSGAGSASGGASGNTSGSGSTSTDSSTKKQEKPKF